MIRQFLSAVAFLTCIPVPSPVSTDIAGLRKSTRWFPAVGFVLGSIYAGMAWLAVGRVPPSVTAVLLLTLDALLTGVLHLDGLADMADGFGGGRSREDVLRIMRDHAIGSYGAAALVLLLLFKFACLSSVIASRDGLWILFVAPTLSRWSMLLMSRSAPYARLHFDGSPVGIGALSQSVSRFDVAFATASCVVLPFAFGAERTLICWTAVALTTVFMVSICGRRIGGITGDTLGATAVLSEALQYAVGMLLTPPRTF